MSFMRYSCVLIFAVSGMFAAPDGARIRSLMTSGDVPGLSAAVVRDGKVVWEGAFGVLHGGSRQPVTSSSIFQAASLTKPVFAYGVMKLVESGQLDLDAPLSKWLPDYMPTGDPAQKITARQVLSHSTGLPNWRRPGMDLKSHFAPGERFSYSGEGYVYLSKIVEKITGQSLEMFMHSSVFGPLGMKNSSLIWQASFERRVAAGHDGGGRPFPIAQGKEANAASSLLTTPGDFARFMVAAIEGRGLKAETKALMFKPHTPVKFMCGECLSPKRKTYEGQMSWALGWGVDQNDGRQDFFQWGDNGIYKAFVVVSPKHRDGVILFMNSVSGLSIATDLVKELLGRPASAMDWLGYERHDSAKRQLVRQISTDGLTDSNRAAVAKLEAADRIAVASDLSERGRLKESLEIGAKAVADSPSSLGHFRLADAYLVTGQMTEAARHYREAVKLTPENKYAADMAEMIESGRIARPSADGNVTFRLKGHADAREVFVSGSFNKNHRRQLPLRKGGDGVWTARVQLPAGKHTYSFFVDGDLVLDPDKSQQEEVQGGKRSVLVVE
jgi:CubicO group peptidase (beta-lactamase class C family)